VIYFIGSGKSGPVKVGYSKSEMGVQERLKSLQTGNPEQLSLLGVIEGSRQGEGNIHRALGKNRIQGEWFKRESAMALLEVLTGNQVGADPGNRQSQDLSVSPKRLGGANAWTGPLDLYWEVEGDSITDDYLPDEISAGELWAEWLEKYVSSDGVARIYWYIEGPNLFEPAPLSPNHLNKDFYSYFLTPRDSSGRNINWLQLPVVDKLWNKDKSDKGGFIQEYTGWKPSPFQQTMDAALIDEVFFRSKWVCAADVEMRLLNAVQAVAT